MTIETRPESEDWSKVEGGSPLQLKHSNGPVRTIELDLDSLHKAGFNVGFGFIKYPLANFAAKQSGVVATIYAHETLSTNFGYGCNSVFIGVIGNWKKEILNVVDAALRYWRGVPDSVIKELSDRSSPGKPMVRVGESIMFGKYESVYHLEDGHLWAPFESGKWYTDKNWL